MNRIRIRHDRRQADTVDGDTISGGDFGGERRLDPEAEAAARWRAFHQTAGRFNESGEHTPRSTRRARAPGHDAPAARPSRTGARRETARPRSERSRRDVQPYDIDEPFVPCGEVQGRAPRGEGSDVSRREPFECRAKRIVAGHLDLRTAIFERAPHVLRAAAAAVVTMMTGPAACVEAVGP